MNVDLIPAFDTNYFFAFDTHNGVAVVDPGQAAPVLNYLGDRKLTHILVTHHHADHIGGVKKLLTRFPDCKVYGPLQDERIMFSTEFCTENDIISCDPYQFQILFVPGHTRSHIAFYEEKQGVLFCGDTLFSLGCGRVFEGTMAEMHSSLKKLEALPDHVTLYCAHEYTADNARFLNTRFPGVEEYRKRMNDNIIPTIPTTLGYEKEHNAFLRAESVEAFTKLREAKDKFS